MAVDNARFPTNIGQGAKGGLVFNTTIHQGATGVEDRIANWPRGIWHGNVGFGIRQAEDIIVARNFMYAAMGQLFPFRFKDHGDFTDEGCGVVIDHEGTLRIGKTYSHEARTYYRIGLLPVVGSFTLNGGGTVDPATGIVTGGAEGDTWEGEFDIGVRFGADAFEGEVYISGPNGLQAFPSIPIIEVIEI